MCIKNSSANIINACQYQQAKDLILNVNKDIRNAVNANANSFDFSKAGYCGTREGYLDGKTVERAIIILRGSGCEWARDENAGCTMCGHLSGSSNGKTVSPQMIKKQFDRAMESYNFEKYPMVCLYNGGSFLNPKEIEPELRRYMFRKINSVPHIKRLIIESRIDYITEQVLDEIEDIMTDTSVEIGLGLESLNEIIRNLILNKGTTNNDYIQLGEMFKGRNIKMLVYILVKPPFLTEREAVYDAVESVKFAHQIGADIVSLEAVSIQDHTLIDFLAKAGIYRTPWIWSIFEIIKATHSLNMTIRIGGFEFYPIPKKFTSNCIACDQKAIQKIREYNMSNDVSVIKDLKCSANCDLRWKEEMNNFNSDDLLTRIIKTFENIDYEKIIKLVTA